MMEVVVAIGGGRGFLSGLDGTDFGWVSDVGISNGGGTADSRDKRGNCWVRSTLGGTTTGETGILPAQGAGEQQHHRSSPVQSAKEQSEEQQHHGSSPVQSTKLQSGEQVETRMEQRSHPGVQHNACL